MENKTELKIWCAAIAVFVILMIQNYIATTRDVLPIPYSEFETFLNDGVVKSVVIGPDTIKV